MGSPKTAEELAARISTLVAGFMDESRQAAERAVQRSLSKMQKASKGDKRRRRSRTVRSHRRSAGELAAICERLYDAVCARPGESMTVFADEIGLSVCALQHPVSKLKAEGRIRSVGERNSRRYFPAVGRPSNDG